MSILDAISTKFGTAIAIATLTLTFGSTVIGQTAPRLSSTQLMDRAQANTLFTEASANIETAKELAESLHSYAKQPQRYVQTEYAAILNDMSAAINKAEENIHQIQLTGNDLNPLQVETAAKAKADLNAMARLTEESIRIFDQQSGATRLAVSGFPENMEQIYKTGDASHRILRDYLSYTRNSTRAKRAMHDLERAS